jgi:ketosteroid isomerase-like protein
MTDTAWIHEIFDAMAVGDGDKVAAFFANDGFAEDAPSDERFEGREAIAKWVAIGPKLSSDATLPVEGVVSDGERFAVQWRYAGTRNADGKSFDIKGASIVELRDGRITSWTDYYNPAPLSG